MQINSEKPKTEEEIAAFNAEKNKNKKKLLERIEEVKNKQKEFEQKEKNAPKPTGIIHFFK